ncbi:MAG: hypothetical protein VX107_16230, partial [Pseudomonadota bacterium]|nr:hypothetical protein [Pseudomonadota bacterium]
KLTMPSPQNPPGLGGLFVRQLNAPLDTNASNAALLQLENEDWGSLRFADADMMKQVTRGGDYDRWMQEYLND